MEDFNFKSYVKNNPLLKEEFKEGGLRDNIDDLMSDAEVGIDNLLYNLKEKAFEVAGQYEGPGVWENIKELIREKL